MKKYNLADLNAAELAKVLQRPLFDLNELESRVKPVLDAVKQKGDQALKEFTSKFDGVDLDQFTVGAEEYREADTLVSEELKAAIRTAKTNIEKFHLTQFEESTKVETVPGVTCWRESRAISKVGLYIPGGTAPLFSTILMLAIPAKMVGCKEIILCTPPNKEGKIHPAILFTIKELGLEKVFKIGGAQAIAAMAYGTESVPKVYKIFGPGNQYVTLAKQLITKDGIAIDMPAGPSEVAVVGDETSNPAFVASDLLSQAEHGVDSQTILVTTSEKLVSEVEVELEKQVSVLPRAEFARKALANSKSIIASNMEEVMDVINDYAPEHLIFSIENFNEFIDKVENAGSVFLGPYTPESAGDYASGTNHTLPTNGYAMNYSGVSLDSYIKKVTFQHITKEGIQNIGPAVEIMAEAEELQAHKNAVTLRLKS
jgi:histidinol dehydrogenase